MKETKEFRTRKHGRCKGDVRRGFTVSMMINKMYDLQFTL